MTYLSLERTRVQTDLLGSDLLPECPRCAEICPVGSTVCAECGAHLLVRPGSGRPFTSAEDPRCREVIGCTCGHAGVCTRCVLFLLDEGLSL